MKLACQGYLPWASYAQRGKQVAVGQFPSGPGAARLKAGGDWPARMGKFHPSHRHVWPLTRSLTPHPAALIIGSCHIPVCLLISPHGVASPWPLTIGVKVTSIWSSPKQKNGWFLCYLSITGWPAYYMALLRHVASPVDQDAPDHRVHIDAKRDYFCLASTLWPLWLGWPFGTTAPASTALGVIKTHKLTNHDKVVVEGKKLVKTCFVISNSIAVLHFYVWKTSVLFEVHTDNFERKSLTIFELSKKLSNASCYGKRNVTNLEKLHLACRAFLVRVARCTNTGKVVNFVNACSMVLTRIRVAIIYICWVNHINILT